MIMHFGNRLQTENNYISAIRVIRGEVLSFVRLFPTRHYERNA